MSAPNSNNSSTGGYILPAPPAPLPSNLTFKQFLQTAFVGISGLDPTLVRPKWEINPAKQPDVGINWLAIGIGTKRSNYNIYNGSAVVNSQIVNVSSRHEDIEVKCSFYGPNSDDYVDVVVDGFQIQQNLEALATAFMGFVYTSEAIRVPDFVNERWIDRYEMSVFLRRERLRTYPILTFSSVSGTIESIVSGNPKTVAWNVETVES